MALYRIDYGAKAISDEALRSSILLAARKLIEQGLYPDDAKLRQRGVRGQAGRIRKMRDFLVEQGELVIPGGLKTSMIRGRRDQL